MLICDEELKQLIWNENLLKCVHDVESFTITTGAIVRERRLLIAHFYF